MLNDARAFRQNLCGWDKSPTSTSVEFWTGSYCGDCDLCIAADILGQTLFLPGAGASCWRMELSTGGTLEGDFSDDSCSKTEFEWQSTNGVFSLFNYVNQLTSTAVFIP